MGARAEFVEFITPLLPGTFEILSTYSGLGELDNPTTAVVQLLRTELAPAPNAQGTILQQFELWVIEPKTDTDELEDTLDDSLDTVLEAVDGCTWAQWTKATRTMHPGSDYHAYKIDLTLATKRN